MKTFCQKTVVYIIFTVFTKYINGTILRFQLRIFFLLNVQRKTALKKEKFKNCWGYKNANVYECKGLSFESVTVAF